MTTKTRLARLEARQKAAFNRGHAKHGGPFGHLPIFARLWEGVGDAIWIQYARPIARAAVKKGYLPEEFQLLPDHYLCRWARLTGARIRAHDEHNEAAEENATEGLRSLFREIVEYAREESACSGDKGE